MKLKSYILNQNVTCRLALLLNGFWNAISLIFKITLIFSLLKAQSCITEEGKYSNIDKDQINQINSKLSADIYKELDSIKDSFKKMTSIVAEAKCFKNAEIEFRRKVFSI